MKEITVTSPLALVSGLYTRSDWFGSGTGLQKQVVETVRLDVDGWFPLMYASGNYSTYLNSRRVDWLADRLKETSAGVWEGEIAYRWGDEQLLPYRLVRIHVPRQNFSVNGARMTITFGGGEAPEVSRVFEFESPYFRTVEFEFDTVETAPRVTSIDTWAHPNRPINLRHEQLTIAEVYSRAGVDIQQSPNTSLVGLEAGVGADIWNDQQLHDAMQMFWSRYKPRAQWALWMLFAHRHVPKILPNGDRVDVLGQMFDNKDRKNPIDPIQRQGAAVFGKTIAEKVPAGEMHPEQWIRREQFFAAVHEIGHCFNLLHSNEKARGNWYFDPGDPLAESFMNYPREVNKIRQAQGLDGDFFGDFEYRFDDFELRFIRHAPDEFIKMGGAAFGEEHGFGDSLFAANPRLALELTVARARPVFEFLEPITVGIRLTNISSQPQMVNPSLLDEVRDLTLIIEPRGGCARKWRPYTRYCSFGRTELLQPGESFTASLFVSAGLDGWYLAEPGSYTLHARLPIHGRHLLAEPLTLRVASPRSREEDYLAQDFFTDEVGRALAFGGTHVMTSALEALQEAADRLSDRAVSRHALLTLALPLMRDSKVLRLPEGEAPMSSVAADGGRITTIEAKPDEARRMLHEALLSDDRVAAETFGYSVHRRHVEMYTDWLEQSGDKGGARKAGDQHPKAPDDLYRKGVASGKKSRRTSKR
jgi:hypothetical protein